MNRLTRQTLVTLERARLLRLLLRGRKWLPRHSLVVLNYHRILDEPTEFDQGVISATPAEFEEQVRLVAQAATVLSMAELCRILDGELRMPDNAVMITFDDGYSDNYHRALPILLRHGVCATFFVTTAYLDGHRLAWWDRVSYVLNHARGERLSVSYPAMVDLRLKTERDRYYARRTLLRLIKQARGLSHERFFAELERAAGVDVDETSLAPGLFMTWEEVRKLGAAGMDIGSHTHSHRVLQTLDGAEVKEELELSHRLIRERLGTTPQAIAYPVGFPLSADSGLREMVRRAGYQVGFTFLPGIIHPQQVIDRLNLPRMSVDRFDECAGARFKAALLAPSAVL